MSTFRSAISHSAGRAPASPNKYDPTDLQRGVSAVTQLLHDHVLAAYNWTQTALQAVFDGIPAEQFLHQPFPGANHALWTMGHLATVDQYFLKSLAGRDGALFDKYRTM